MRRLSINTLTLLANNIISAGLAYLISVIVARSLGTDGFGQYNFITAWVAPLVTLADFGMGSLVTRDVAQNRALVAGMLHTATRGLFFVAVPLLILAWLVIPLLRLSPTVALALALTTFLIILDPWFGLYTASFRAFQKMWPIPVVNVTGLILQLILIGLAVITRMGLIGIAAAIIVVNVLQLIATWGLWRKYGIPPNPTQAMTNTPRIRQLFSRAWPFALAALLNTLQMQLNVLLLKSRADYTAIGLYSAASAFVEGGRLIPGALFGALFPALSSLVGQPVAMRRTFIQATGLIMGFAVAFGLAMMVIGGWLLRFTYGAEFERAMPILTILAWALLPSLLRGILTLYLYSLGREHFVNAVTLIALGFQAVIGWLAIGQFGAIGAAVSIGIVEGGTCLCLGYALRTAQ